MSEIGSVRWSLGLAATMAASVVIATCPVWWAIAAWWDLNE